MNLKETVDLIQQTAQQAQAIAAKLTPLNLQDDDPRLFRYVLNGQLQALTIRGPEPFHTTFDVASLIALAQDSDECPAPTIWLSGEKIRLVFDSPNNFGRATFDLMRTASWNKLVNAMSGAKSQKTLRELFKVHLADCPITPTNLLDAIASVKFEQNDSEETKLAPQNAALGRNIEQKVSGAIELPEEITVTLPIFRPLGPGLEEQPQARIRLALLPDFEHKGFRLEPMADSVQTSIDDTMVWLRAQLETLAGEAIPVYYGEHD